MAYVKSHEAVIFVKCSDSKYHPLGMGVESLSLSTSNEVTEKAVILYENPISTVKSGGISATITSVIDNADTVLKEIAINESLGITDKDYDIIQAYLYLVKDNSSPKVLVCKKYKSKLPANELALAGGTEMNLSIAMSSSGKISYGYIDTEDASYDEATMSFEETIFTENPTKVEGVFVTDITPTE